MSILSRIERHTKLSIRAATNSKKQTPPFMIVFINSICNLTCERCFYGKELNKRDDLKYEEFEKLSLELGDFENLNLSGGEPFIQPEFGEICTLFIKNNNVKNIYVPTNGYFTDRTEKSLRKVLANKSLEMFVCELSLDGMPEYHNKFRGNAQSFQKAMETYEMLARLQKEDPRLRIHSNTVAISENMDEIEKIRRFRDRSSRSTKICTGTSRRFGAIEKSGALVRRLSRCCNGRSSRLSNPNRSLFLARQEC
jgi:sulfatase maturation enzyme AslB (radical SAM superfamily)